VHRSTSMSTEAIRRTETPRFVNPQTVAGAIVLARGGR
jgi:hypothetical protein